MDSAENRPFGRFLIIWGGQLVSGIGTGVTAFTLGVYAFEQTQSTTVYSMIILSAFLPAYLLKPLGGTLVDRLDRRWLMVVGDLGSMLGVVFIILLFMTGVRKMAVIFTGVAASSIFVAVQNPAYKASVTDLLDERIFAKASGLMQLSESSRFLVSPLLAGFLMQVLPIEKILILDAATFVIAAFAVIAVKGKITPVETARERRPVWDDFIDGFQYTLTHKGLLCLLSVTSVITFAVGFLQALMGPMLLTFTDAKTLGIVQTCSASGMLAGSLFIGIFSRSRNQVTILVTALAMAGLFYALFGATVRIAFIITAGFLFFTSLPFINTALEVLIRKNIPNQIQGRVWSIVSLISQLGMIIAFSIAGFLADRIFNPMLENGGFLAPSLGKVIGSGPGRGIGFMFIICGALFILIAWTIRNSKPIRDLEKAGQRIAKTTYGISKTEEAVF